jgi:hypothetical protein
MKISPMLLEQQPHVDMPLDALAGAEAAAAADLVVAIPVGWVMPVDNTILAHEGVDGVACFKQRGSQAVLPSHHNPVSTKLAGSSVKHSFFQESHQTFLISCKRPRFNPWAWATCK